VKLLGENYKLQDNRIFRAQAEWEVRGWVAELSEGIVSNDETFLWK